MSGGRLQGRVFGWMFAESLVYAAIFGRLVSWLTAMLLSGGQLALVQEGPLESLPVATQLVVSLGAGIYEELLFRVLLVAGLIWVFNRMRWRRGAVIGAAIVGSALIFSAFHYIGPYGDQLTLSSFVFRTIAGLLLSGLYVWRGFGVTAWTHALYDIWLSVL